MRTEKQKEASRRNGSKSKGPITAEGKANSSQNATKHGLAGATAAILSNEDEGYYQAALDRYIRRFQPADDTELELVERMAAASWRLRRAAGLEIAMFNVEMERQREEVDAEFEQVGETARQYLAFESIAADNGKAQLLHRYELRALRLYNSALRNLMWLQGDRKPPQKRQEPNEPEKHTENTAPAANTQPVTGPCALPARDQLPGQPCETGAFAGHSQSHRQSATLRNRRPVETVADITPDWSHPPAQARFFSAA